MNPTRSSFVCASCARALRQQTQPSTNILRSFSSTPPNHALAEEPEPSKQLPRWKTTPAAMKMPIRLRPQPRQPVWRVNNDDAKLCEVYDRFLHRIVGPNEKGRDLLDEETRWLAITHKSYDHGRRGFNDRLAFLGKRIVDLQTSLALLSAPGAPLYPPPEHVYQHPNLQGLENINAFTKAQFQEKTRLARLARSYGIDKVMRWKPRRSDNLEASGIDVVMAHTLYSIIGALAMQRGGEIAARTAREKILRPLGLRAE